MVCVCVGFVMFGVCMCGCFGSMCTCTSIYCVFILLHLCIFILCMLLFNFVSYVFLLLCLCTLVYVLFCIFHFHHANLHSLATLTEVPLCFFFNCKANARVELAKTWHGQHSSQINCVVLCIVCVLYYCHQVSTQLHLTNISIHLCF